MNRSVRFTHRGRRAAAAPGPAWLCTPNSPTSPVRPPAALLPSPAMGCEIRTNKRNKQTNQTGKKPNCERRSKSQIQTLGSRVTVPESVSTLTPYEARCVCGTVRVCVRLSVLWWVWCGVGVYGVVWVCGVVWCVWYGVCVCVSVRLCVCVCVYSRSC